jgi:2-oxoglutarate ferredoxin oxidoreductase subunit alpha
LAIDLTLGIAGSGGDGVILLGELLARSAARAGLHATLVKTFGPQIRGGETSVRLRIADRPLSGADHRLDALLLFHYADMLPFASELPLAPDTQLFVDSADTTPLELVALPEALKHGAIHVPLEELAIGTVRNKQAKNMVLCGVIAEYFGWDRALLRETVAQRFARHGDAVIASNQLAVKAGRSWVGEHLESVAQTLLSANDGRQECLPHQPLYFLSGNEAFSLGALHAGCRFMAGYPISPASEILEWMTKQLPRFGGQCVQAEDEIAAVCLAIGASYGGARVLTATSGPGFSLKQEAIGLAHMAELPLVVCNVQRCGPSTGIPTRTEQADLQIALHGGHGDNPRVVLAATTVADCYELAHAAFEIAEKYQTPVIVLLDQLISQSQQTVEGLEVRVRDELPLTVGVAPASSVAWQAVAGQGVGQGAGPVKDSELDKVAFTATPEDFHSYTRKLPHWRLSGSVYFVTWRLHESRPDLSDDVRNIVADNLKHFNGERYHLVAYVVMNDHVHVLLKPVEGWELSRILQSSKSFTAGQINKALGTTGPVWQDESWDRIVRDEAELLEKAQYILNNPGKRWPDEATYEWLYMDLEAAGRHLEQGALEVESRQGQRPVPPNISDSSASSDQLGAVSGPFKRYSLTPSGVSPRTLPGTPGGEYIAVGIEHDEMSDPTSSQAMHQAQTEKRFRKLQGAVAEYPLLRITGADKPRLGIITWGSTYGVCAEAARQLTEAGVPTSVLAPRMLYPLDMEAIQQWIGSAEQLLVVELNFEGQLFRHLRGYVDLPRETLLLSRPGGSPISLTELLGFMGNNIELPAEFNAALEAGVLTEQS